MAPRDPWSIIAPSWLDAIRATAWAPPNLPLFAGGPSAGDPATAAPPTSGAGQSSLSFPIFGYGPALPVVGAAGANPLPSAPIDQDDRRDLVGEAASPNVRLVSDKFDFGPTPPIAPPAPFMDPNPFFGSPRDQPLYRYTDPFRAGMAPDPGDSNPSAHPSAPQNVTRPAAPIPLPRPRPPEAFEPPFGTRIPMYPMPPKPPNPRLGYFDPTTNGYPLAVPPELPRPNFEDRSSSPWWLANMSAPISDTNFTSPPNVQFLRKQLAAQNVDANDFVDRVIYAESRGDPYRHARGSTAVGAGQFLTGTWREELAKHRPELITENPWLPAAMRQPQAFEGKGKSKDELASVSGLSGMRQDYALSRQMTAEYLNELSQALDHRGFPVTPGNLYLMYVAGSGDGVELMKAITRDPNTPARAVAPNVVQSNLGLTWPNLNPTVGELRNAIARRITDARADLLPFNRASPFRR